MFQPHSASGQAQVLDTMVGLTRLSNLHRAIIGGRDGMQLYHGLRRRGFIRLAPVSSCWNPRRQHPIGLIADHDSAESIESALSEISPFLSEQATVAILIDSRGSGPSLRVRSKLQQMGFRIEAGVRCQRGLVMSAYRPSFVQMERAA